MIIEMLIIHVLSYFYFQPIGNDEAKKAHAVSRSLQLLWGCLFSVIVLTGLNDFNAYFSSQLFLIVSGLLMGYILYENKLKYLLNLFFSSNLNSEHALYSVYVKNRSIIQFMLHQVIYLLWIVSLNELVTISTNPFILAAISLVFLGIFILSLYALNQRDKGESLSWNTVLKHASTYVVLSAVTLTLLKMISKGLVVLEQTSLPIRAIITQSPYRVLVAVIFILLLLMKPTNLVIRAVSAQYDPKKDAALSAKSDQDSGFKGAGAMIGNLERLLILLSFFFGSLLSVVAILSIKAFARYKLIVEDPYFSEYFVIGTMLSVLITFTCYVLLVLVLV